MDDFSAYDYGNQVAISISHDSCMFAVGRENGFEVYTIIDAETVKKVCSMDCGNVSLISLHYSTPLVFAVPTKKSDLLILNIYKKKRICRIEFEREIKFVASNNFHFVVCTTDAIKIYHVLHTTIVWEIPHNTNLHLDTCALSASTDYTRFAYQLHPGRLNIKHVIGNHGNNRNIIALRLPYDLVSAIAFNDDASLLCAASREDQHVQIFSATTGTVVHTFHLGTMTSCTVSQLCFDDDVGVLVCGYTSRSWNRAKLFRLADLKEKLTTRAAGQEVVGASTGRNRSFSLSDTLSDWKGGMTLIRRHSTHLLSYLMGDEEGVVSGKDSFELDGLSHSLAIKFSMKANGKSGKVSVVSLDRNRLILHGFDCSSEECTAKERRHFFKRFDLSQIDGEVVTRV